MHNEVVQVERVAIFGSGGQLGVELVAEFNSRGYQVAAFERTMIDITDQAQVERCMAQVDPALVINAAAYNQVDIAEKEPQAAFLVNALAVRNLAMACPAGRRTSGALFDRLRFRWNGGTRLHRRRSDASLGRIRGIEARRRAVCARVSRSSADHQNIGCLRTRRAKDGAEISSS